MKANEYQKAAARTLIAEPDNEYTQSEMITVLSAISDAISTGGYTDAVKKGVFHKTSAHYMRTVPKGLPKIADRLTDPEIMNLWNLTGLIGEASEVARVIYESICDQTPVDRVALVKEIGDVLWYVAALCTKNGITLEDAMQGNIEKLARRYPQGYSSEAAAAKTDEQEASE